jgi:agmatine deiminase
MTPRELGYRMPAEWAPHTATWLSWPRPDGISFPDRYEEVIPTVGELVRALVPNETVNINVRNDEVEAIARGTTGDIANVFYHRIPAYEPWCRDHGPIFVRRDRDLAVVDWGYNAWGGKYPPFDDDDAVPQRIAELLRLPLFQPPMILEGGSIDVNGEGVLLTTEACLLNRNRNPLLSKTEIEQHLRDYLGVTDVIWLGAGIVGDDTDGHVDDLTRFVNPTTVVTVVEEDPQDENFAPLQDNLKRLQKTGLKIVELPMPSPVEYEGRRLPASYANFYIANNVVLLPTFRQPKNDAHAQEILQKLFAKRRVIGIDSTNLIWGLGSFHCLTQQQPAL